MDVLSDTLRVVRLAGAIFFTAKVSGPWSVQSATSSQYASLMHSQADCITLFHIVVDGQCWVTVDGHCSLQLAAGDVVIFPHAESHIMGSHPDAFGIADLTAPLLNYIQSASPDAGIPCIDFGRPGQTTHIVCGYLECNQRFNPLLGSLPPVLLIRSAQLAAAGLPEVAEGLSPSCIVRTEAGDWLDNTLQYTIQEAAGDRPGSSAMLPRLTELLFVEVVRRYMQQLPPEGTGWLAAVRDPVIGNVLRLMHTNPDRHWTVADLAHATASSRSALAQRFTTLVGESPMQYLQGWRMQVAKNLLGRTNLSISDIAQRTGYDSEPAFNRAFKRSVGQPPATWRASV